MTTSYHKGGSGVVNHRRRHDKAPTVVGNLRIQIVEGQNFTLPAFESSGWWKRIKSTTNKNDDEGGSVSKSQYRKRNSSSAPSSSLSPYVVLSTTTTLASNDTNESVRSSTVFRNNHPSWSQEVLHLPIIVATPHVDKNIQVFMAVDIFSDDVGMAAKAGEALGLLRSGGGSLIGSASVDVTTVIDGTVPLLDKWVSLLQQPEAESSSAPSSKKTLSATGGELHVIITYEPLGLEPSVGDIVELVGYGPHPTGVLPNSPGFHLTVAARSGNYVLATYEWNENTTTQRKCQVRLHRHVVHVVGRTTFFDRAFNFFWTTPVSVVLSTPVGKSVAKTTAPYVNVLVAMTAPATLAAKGALFATFRAIRAAIQSIFIE